MPSQSLSLVTNRWGFHMQPLPRQDRQKLSHPRPLDEVVRNVGVGVGTLLGGFGTFMLAVVALYSQSIWPF